MKVNTAEGLIERQELEVLDLVHEDDNVRVTATEWRHEGRLVRRDVHVNVLHGLDVQAQGNA